MPVIVMIEIGMMSWRGRGRRTVRPMMGRRRWMMMSMRRRAVWPMMVRMVWVMMSMRRRAVWPMMGRRRRTLLFIIGRRSRRGKI